MSQSHNTNIILLPTCNTHLVTSPYV